MADLPKSTWSLSWLCHIAGLASLHQTGRDACLIILSRTCRMFAFGAVSLTIALFFAEIGFSDFRIGLFMSLTLLGDVVLGVLVTLMADGLGRRRVLFAGGLLMALSGAVFCAFENFWVLLLAAIVGVVSAGGDDFGPFRAIEESMLAHITTPDTRAHVLSWYVTSSCLGSAAGTELAGRVFEAMTGSWGWSEVRVYHAAFLVYIMMGGLNMIIAFSLSSSCEIATWKDETDETTRPLLAESDGDVSSQPSSVTLAPKGRFSQISSPTRSAMYKLWFLLTIDSLADGMVSRTLTTYFLDRKFNLSKADLGDIMSTALLLAAVSTVFAGPLAHHLGLLNTMVFTHLPSSVAVLLFPFPSGIVLTIVLLYIRMGLNNMDQAPRSAFIAAIVREDERTAVLGITSALRTLAMTLGPSFTGGLAGSGWFPIAFIVGGTLRIVYDLGLWAMFVNVRLHAHEASAEEVDDLRVDDEEAEPRRLE